MNVKGLSLIRVGVSQVVTQVHIEDGEVSVKAAQANTTNLPSQNIN